MPKLILCRGIQGSGKTTWAKQYCKEHPNSIRVNRDDIRAIIVIFLIDLMWIGIWLDIIFMQRVYYDIE